MLHITRNSEGKIDSIFLEEKPGITEAIDNNDPEVLEFIQVDSKTIWDESDKGFIRVLEDLIELLLIKHVITITELPPSAIKRIVNRKKIRDFISVIDEL